MSAARKRVPATVALDLRLPGQAAAAAVDGRGTLIAWATVSDTSGGDPAALARQALRELRVRPQQVRVLLGEAQVAVLDHTGTPPGAGAIAAALFAEGYERLRDPAVSALAAAPGAWLVAACEAAVLEPLAAALLAESGTEPVFLVDQLLAAADLTAGSALAEHGETGLLIAAAVSGSPLFVRALPAVGDVEAAARESRDSLEAIGFQGTVQMRGPHREPLAQALAESGMAALAEALPASGGEPLPAACELAWRAALRPAVPLLASPQSERRRASLGWARRAVRVALVAAALGALAMLIGLRLSWVSRVKNRALAAQTAGDVRLVKELREIEALVGEVERLRAETAGQTAPWPRLAGPVAALARQLPPEVGWERFEIRDGALKLEAAAAGAAPAARLELLRHTLERSPALANLSWEAPAADGGRLRQIFHAALRGAPAAPPGGKP